MRTFRVRYEKRGAHYHCRVFSAKEPTQTFAKLGDLVLDEDDWDTLPRLFAGSVQILEESA